MIKASNVRERKNVVERAVILSGDVTTIAARAPHEVDDLRAALADARPDALVVDGNSWGAISAAEDSGLPF
ncbi:MAG: hypothetical protein IT374_28180, partial [Polyangiaceae bacterium]|nr:hypothetical protein [Polyangiaceae bacterium]